MKYTSPDILEIFKEEAADKAEQARQAALTAGQKGEEDGADLFAKHSSFVTRWIKIRSLAYPVVLAGWDRLAESECPEQEYARAAAAKYRSLREKWVAQQPDAAELTHYFAEVEAARRAVPEARW